MDRFLRAYDAPSPSPTQLPWNESIRILQTATAESISVTNRVIIGSVCIYRLLKYKKAGVLDFTELKTIFHLLMLWSVLLSLPYFSYCLIRYETWQCWANKNEVRQNVYISTWTVYSLQRIGLSFQLAYLSVTVLCWYRSSYMS
jgi:hypothetical protein